MKENQEKKYEKSATTKLNVKFNSPHFNEAKKRSVGTRGAGVLASQSFRCYLLPALFPLSLPLSLFLLLLSLIQLKLLGDQLRYVQLL